MMKYINLQNKINFGQDLIIFSEQIKYKDNYSIYK